MDYRSFNHGSWIIDHGLWITQLWIIYRSLIMDYSIMDQLWIMDYRSFKTRQDKTRQITDGLWIIQSWIISIQWSWIMDHLTIVIIILDHVGLYQIILDHNGLYWIVDHGISDHIKLCHIVIIYKCLQFLWILEFNQHLKAEF